MARTAEVIIRPKYLLVSEYTVLRTDQYPSVRLVCQECDYKLRPALTVLSSADPNNDGLSEELTVADLGATPNVVGHTLSDARSTALATITAAERLEPSPDTFVTKLTLSAGLSSAQLQAPLAVVEQTPLGINAYMPGVNGRRWSITLTGNTPENMQAIAQCMGAAYFGAVKAALGVLNITTVTDAQLLGAVQGLAGQGVNIDTFLADQAEALDAAYSNGQLPHASRMQL